MRTLRFDRAANCERCPASRPIDAVVWIRRALLFLAFPASLLWALFLVELGPAWANPELRRRRHGPVYVYFLPALVTVGTAAVLPRPREWRCPDCGHVNRRLPRRRA